MSAWNGLEKYQTWPSLKEPNETWLPLFVFDKQTRDFIGATGFHHYNWAVPCLETDYWIRRTYAGKGLMTEAINAITQYAFKQLRVKLIAITCDVDNIRSRNIPERLHYVLEGVLKSNRLKPLSRDVTDTLIFAKYSLDNLPCVSVTWSDTK
ncbi:GNAT family N-acetyltransferase [Legionella sp. CNM-4043-24]|uniref:GNAT family N-acetyltransferase n=1 Tax=Legionella sp. CNM-4043-24 TaxID=3421646 RepID=UPI00403AF3F7